MLFSDRILRYAPVRGAVMALLMLAGLLSVMVLWVQPAGAAESSVQKIGIIGAGNMGEALGRLWADAGDQVMLSSRHPEALTALARDMGHRTLTGTPQEAVRFGDVVVMAVPYGALPGLGQSLAAELKGKTVLDVSNPYPWRDGLAADYALKIGSGRASAHYLSGADVVRAFNSLTAGSIASSAHHQPPVAIPLAGDSPQALARTEQLIRQAGFVPVVTGNLDTAVRFQPGSALFLQVLDEKTLRAQLAQVD